VTYFAIVAHALACSGELQFAVSVSEAQQRCLPGIQPGFTTHRICCGVTTSIRCILAPEICL